MYNIHNLNVKNIASEDVSRFALCCVNFTPTETQATDGHVLVRVTIPPPLDGYEPPDGLVVEKEFKSVTVHKEIVGKIKRAVDTGDGRQGNRVYPLQGFDGSKASFLLQNLLGYSVFSSPVETKKFPNVDVVERSVLGPDSKQEAEFSLNPVLFKNVCEQFANFVETTSPQIKVQVFGKDKPVVFSASRFDGQKMTVYLMPIRDS